LVYLGRVSCGILHVWKRKILKTRHRSLYYNILYRRRALSRTLLNVEVHNIYYNIYAFVYYIWSDTALHARTLNLRFNNANHRYKREITLRNNQRDDEARWFIWSSHIIFCPDAVSFVLLLLFFIFSFANFSAKTAASRMVANIRVPERYPRFCIGYNKCVYRYIYIIFLFWPRGYTHKFAPHEVYSICEYNMFKNKRIIRLL